MPNYFSPTLFVTLYSADRLVIWGDEKTKFRFGAGGEVLELKKQGRIYSDMQFPAGAASETAYQDGFYRSHSIDVTGVTFPVSLQIQYAQDTKNAGFRCNGGNISGMLPEVLERWTVQFVNNIPSCPNTNWTQAGFSSYGIKNWNTIKGNLRHFSIVDYKALLTTNPALFQQDITEVFDLRGNEVLESYSAFGIKASPAEMGLNSRAKLHFINDENNAHFLNNTPETYLQGLDLTGLNIGVRMPNPNDREHSANVTSVLLAAMAGAAPQAAPGAWMALGFFDPENPNAAILAGKGYTVVNGNS